jgi:hypothetical protein
MHDILEDGCTQEVIGCHSTDVILLVSFSRLTSPNGFV